MYGIGLGLGSELGLELASGSGFASDIAPGLVFYFEVDPSSPPSGMCMQSKPVVTVHM